MKKKLKKGSALALALVLTLSTVVMSKVQVAISIETDRQCSVKLSWMRFIRNFQGRI